VASVFCEHRRVKTICPECKPRLASPVPEPVSLPSGVAPGPRAEARAREPAEEVLRGPGKPLLPQRKRVRRVTADDAASAEAWWVRKD
jgi:hypothetical protein